MSAPPRSAPENVRSARSRRGRSFATSACLFLLFVVVGAYTVRSLRGLVEERTERGPVREIARSEGESWLAREFRSGAIEARIGGSVRAADGRPIAGARVCAICAACEPAEAPAQCAVSDGAGAYALGGELRGAMIVSAAAEGFRSALANGGAPVVIGSAGRSDVDLVLEEGGARITGTVLDALGGPVAQARVRATRYDGATRTPIEVQSDDEGRFELWAMAGSLELRAEADGYAPKSRNVAAPANAIELVLTPASVVRGRVVLRGSDDGVASVSVRAVPAHGMPRAPSALSDEEGNFELRGVDPGMYTLSAESEGYRGVTSTLEVGLAEVVPEVVVEVVPAVSLIGRVSIGSEGRPCTRGHVTLGPPSLSHAALSKDAPSAPELDDPSSVPTLLSRLDGDGTVRFRGLTRGRYHALLHCEGHVLEQGPEQIDVGDKNLEVDWKMRAGLGLTVNVVDESARPVPGASVELVMVRADGKGPPIGMAHVANERGRIEIPRHLYPGSYTVRPLGGAQGEPVTVTLREGREREEVTLRLTGSARLDLLVEDGEGRPLDGLYVAARRVDESGGERPKDLMAALGKRAQALGEGRYRLHPLAAGAYSVEVRDGTNPPIIAQGPTGARVELRSGAQQELRVKLPPRARLEGKVVDDRGEPQSNVWVSVTPEQPAGPHDPSPLLLPERARVMTDVEGEFTLERLARDGRYRLNVQQPFGAEAVKSGVTAGERVTIVLPATGSVAGTVVDEKGAPLATGDVSARHTASGAVRVGRMLGSGRFQIERLPSGAVTLQVVTHDGAGGELSLELAPGQKHDGVRLVAAPAPATPPSAAEPPAAPPSSTASAAAPAEEALAKRAAPP